MNMHFQRVTWRTELSALMTVTAVLMAGMLTKLGLGWWAIVVSLCLLGPKRPAPRHAATPVLK